MSHAVAIATFAFHLERLDEEAVVKLHLTEKVPNCGVARWEYKVDVRPRWRRMAWAKNLHAIPPA